MAILLTKDYQVISRIYLTYGQVITYAKYTDQSIEDATTSYKLKTTYYIYEDGYYNQVSFDNGYNYLDGSERYYGYTTMYRGETQLQEVTRTAQHSEDGTSPTKNVETSWSASFGGTGYTNVDIVFPKIQRYSMMQSATNFNDEENPSMTFTNVGLYDLRAKMKVGNIEITSVDLTDSSATSYTFNLTTAQRNHLQQLCTGKTLEVTLQIVSVDNNTELYTSSTTVTMSMINAEPTFTYTIVETNENVISVLGGTSASSIVDNASNVKITVTPTTYKNATVAGVTVTSGGITYTNTTSPYEINVPITDNTFTIGVIDSRGYTTTQVDSARTLINYEPLKINSFSFVRYSPTSSDIILNFESVYYNSIGSTTNTPAVKWKLGSGNWNTIPSSNYTIDTTNNKLTITNYTMTNALAYTSQGQFTVYIEDLLTNTQDSGQNGLVLMGIPTYDAGEHDLQVNGDLYVADNTRNNKVNILTQINSALSIANSKVKISVLWTNNAPTSDFSSQYIELSSNDYDYLIFLNMCIAGTNYSYRGLQSSIVPKGNNVSMNNIFYNDNANVMVYSTRLGTYTNDTKYYISNTIFTSTDQPSNPRVDNQFTIPYMVLGIK